MSASRIRGIAKLLEQVRAADADADEPFEVEAEDELPFVQVGHWVALSGVSAGALALYWMLAMHLNQARGDRYVWPTTAILAHMLGYSRGDKIKRFADELVAIGALVVIPVTDGKGPQKRNVYRLRRTPPAGYAGPTSLSSYYAHLSQAYDEETAGQPVYPETGVDVAPQTGGHVTPEMGGVTTRSSNNKKENDEAPSARSALGARSASTSGSSAREVEGGSAASSKTQPAPPPQETPAPAGKPKAKRPRHTREQLRQAGEVCELFPALLGVRLVPTLADAILKALAGDVPGAERTAAQLGARIDRRWSLHGYAEKFHAGTLESPVGAAIAMVLPLAAGDRHGCANPRCEDGADVDTGQPCTVCPERLSDRRAARRDGTDARRAPGNRRGVPDRRAGDSPAQEPLPTPQEAYAAPMPQPVPEPPAVPAQFVPAGDYVTGAATARAIMQDHKASARRRTNRHGGI